MGAPIDRERFEEAEYQRFAAKLDRNLHAIRRLLARPEFGQGPSTLGAELELSVADAEGRPLPLNRELRERALDPQLQLEVDRFNLEYNLQPVPAHGRPFAALRAELAHAIDEVNAVAAPYGGRAVPVGILQTLRGPDMQSVVLTDAARYRALSNGLRRLRQHPFQVHIDGDPPLRTTADDITLEGATTSFQVHLRLPPQQLADTYNAVQLATPLAVAISGNSPIFLEHVLWEETRVALFKQAVDSRNPLFSAEWHRPARVSFGHGWVRHGAYELFSEAVAIFPPLIPIMDDQEPLEAIDAGRLPSLWELRLHQSTVWRWNRPIYDDADGGHLRIEMRALPSGPTPLDMAANAALLLGLAIGLRDHVETMLPGLPFEHAHRNFYRAAQQGLDATLLWPSQHAPSPREHDVPELLWKLLPTAEAGLRALQVEDAEIRALLDVIRGRLRSGTTPARWQRRALSRMPSGMSRRDALARLLEAYLAQCASGKPVHEWSEAT